jgi:acetyl esterase/lipase
MRRLISFRWMRIGCRGGHSPEEPNSSEARLVGGPIQTKCDVVTAANPIVYVTPDDPPFLILHGDKDLTVPHHQSELLRDALRAAGVQVQFQTVVGAGHGGPLFQTPEIARSVVAFFDQYLRGAAH